MQHHHARASQSSAIALRSPHALLHQMSFIIIIAKHPKTAPARAMPFDGSLLHTASQHTAVQQMRHALVINHPSERVRLGAAQRLCADLRLDCRRIQPPALEHASVTGCVARGRANCSLAHERQRQCQAMTPKECSILLAHAMAWRALGRARPAAA